MSDNQTGVIVLAAGLGTRMKSSLPKALQPIGGRPMVGHLMATLGGLEAARTIVVVGPDMEAVAAAVAPARTAVQPDRLGTADAVKAARDAMQGLGGTVLIVFADTSLIRRETLARMIAAREAGAAVVVLGFRPQAKADYGRLITAADGALERIVEAGDATPEELGIDLCNSGVMAVDGAAL
ncbi:MAG: NTP transferase domain-containing protein, partial [Alphaproteobacteria bacterium]|nr:NTP transferase domain-containing protein [Alphaproteobacteria bacterium]